MKVKTKKNRKKPKKKLNNEIIQKQNHKYRFALIGVAIVMFVALLHAGQLNLLSSQLSLLFNAAFYIVIGLAGLFFLLANIGIVFQMIIFVIFAGMFFVILEKILRYYGLIF
ncbi:hypothetical protein [Candidatus Pelagibacter sp. HIMB1506]|uniref:hypothetical protein n=1 Tax=Candidatus Pelagibacter sp. HIMB1506 TaxID=3413337 RepID=UPI003F82975C